GLCDFDAQLWAARHDRLLSHADVAGERLGSRRVRPGAGDPEHPLGSWPTVCRRDRRSVRHRARAVRRRRPLRDRPHPDGLFALIFGTRWLATLAGLAFFSHQVGGFLGVWLGGIAFVRTGSYDVVWWLSILFGVLSAVINLPIVEKPVVRAAAAPA